MILRYGVGEEFSEFSGMHERLSDGGRGKLQESSLGAKQKQSYVDHIMMGWRGDNAGHDRRRRRRLRQMDGVSHG